MNKATFSMICALTFAGETLATTSTIRVSDLTEKDGKYYELGHDNPYTGRVIGKFYDGQIRSEAHYKNGLKDGKEINWYSNGNLRKEFEYKNGMRHGTWRTWNLNQQVLFEHNYN